MLVTINIERCLYTLFKKKCGKNKPFGKRFRPKTHFLEKSVAKKKAFLQKA
jgi:hypothetical protein